MFVDVIHGHYNVSVNASEYADTKLMRTFQRGRQRRNRSLKFRNWMMRRVTFQMQLLHVRSGVCDIPLRLGMGD